MARIKKKSTPKPQKKKPDDRMLVSSKHIRDKPVPKPKKKPVGRRRKKSKKKA